ncbi:hypothetical protein ACQP00_29855 [Dactylosporangium sp. CS-047395]|uniref:hypothetical protein n=1 Tax=Dactylosporangium sp. CS-047395 TaxID=3239936 RepID=UPI003D9021CC
MTDERIDVGALTRCDARFARDCYHWFFFAQPDKPERALNADPDAPIWRPWAPDLRGEPIESGQHVAEENPAALTGALLRFLSPA